MSSIVHVVTNIARTDQIEDYFSSHTGYVYLEKHKAQLGAVAYWTIQVADAVTPATLSNFNNAPIGSTLFCRANGLYARKTGATTWELIGGISVVADPGDAAAIPVTYNHASIAITTAAAETNTLAIPTKVGQTLAMYCDTYAVGDRVITCAAAINAANNTIMTFGVVSDYIKLEAITLAGALVWQVVSNDGVALS